jgi:hypothetical protein
MPHRLWRRVACYNEINAFHARTMLQDGRRFALLLRDEDNWPAAGLSIALAPEVVVVIDTRQVSVSPQLPLSQ